MKDSGIEWIGEIPEHWEIVKGKVLFKQRNSKGNKDLILLSPTQKYGVIPQNLYEELSGMKSVKMDEKTDLNSLKTININDFCISLRSFQGGFELSRYNGVVSNAYQVFYAYNYLVEDYYKYMFKDKAFIDKMNSYTLSLRDGKNISFNDFGNTYIPYPPIEEQKAIASHLNQVCGAIDSLKSDIENQIEILQEYKKSVITEAVTKGLNKDVEMKESGIDWIEEVPKHWNIIPLKYALSCPMKYGATESGVEYNEKLPRYIRITDITLDGKLKDNGKLSLTENQANGYILNKKCILFARSGATVGKTFMYKTEYGRAAFAGYLISAVLDESKMKTEWLRYYSLSNNYWEWANMIFTQATVQNIGADKYVNLPITIPPIKEQEEIVSYLDSKCSEIDSIIESKKQQLEILEEYKKSTIYEYVTGKRGVSRHE